MFKRIIYPVLVLLAFVFSSVEAIAQSEIPLADCPGSPNCITSKYYAGKRKEAPFSFKGDLAQSRGALKALILDMEGTVLVDSSEYTLHFEFTTSVGNYVDDVEFYLDETHKVIHFRSASRIGYGDLGANKRRIKKIRKAWDALSEEG